MLTNPCLCIFGDAFHVVHVINKDYKILSIDVLKPYFRLTKIL